MEDEGRNIAQEIRDILPKLPVEDAAEIAKTLVEESGVESMDDLKLVQEEDLSMLKPIQIRKLIQAWKDKGTAIPQMVNSVKGEASTTHTTGEASAGEATAFHSTSPQSTVCTADWVNGYSVPWKKMSTTFVAGLERGERPNPSQRREMVRSIIDDVRKVCPVPKKRQLSYIARRIVAKYPRAFKDTLAGHTIGSGYDSLLKNLVDRSQNANRQSTGEVKSPATCKKGGDSKKKEEDGKKGSDKKHSTDSYGCINFQPDMPDGEMEIEHRKHIDEMKAAYQRGVAGTDPSVGQSMVKTYPLQRNDIINEELHISELHEEWPYLFEEQGMVIHFEQLVGLDVRETFETTYEKKGKHIIDFLTATNKKSMISTLKSMERAKGMLGNSLPEVPGLILLAMDFFGETHSALFLEMETTTTTMADVKKKFDIPAAPAVIVCGDLFTAEKYMLSIDGDIINKNIPTFAKALVMMFASFYVFAIEYPTEASATLDFLQRCIFNINPDRGNKQRNKKHSINPRVLQFINLFQDYFKTALLC